MVNNSFWWEEDTPASKLASTKTGADYLTLDDFTTDVDTIIVQNDTGTYEVNLDMENIAWSIESNDEFTWDGVSLSIDDAVEDINAILGPVDIIGLDTTAGFRAIFNDVDAKKGQAMEDYDIVNKMLEYEDGNMSDEEVISFFQELVDSGLVWQLQGNYGRTAQALIDAGYVTAKTASKIAQDFINKYGIGDRVTGNDIDGNAFTGTITDVDVVEDDFLVYYVDTDDGRKVTVEEDTIVGKTAQSLYTDDYHIESLIEDFWRQYNAGSVTMESLIMTMLSEVVKSSGAQTLDELLTALRDSAYDDEVYEGIAQLGYDFHSYLTEMLRAANSGTMVQRENIKMAKSAATNTAVDSFMTLFSDETDEKTDNATVPDETEIETDESPLGDIGGEDELEVEAGKCKKAQEQSMVDILTDIYINAFNKFNTDIDGAFFEIVNEIAKNIKPYMSQITSADLQALEDNWIYAVTSAYQKLLDEADKSATFAALFDGTGAEASLDSDAKCKTKAEDEEIDSEDYEDEESREAMLNVYYRKLR